MTFITPLPRRRRTGMFIWLGVAGLLVFIALALVGTLVSVSIFGLLLNRSSGPHFTAADVNSVMLTSAQGSRFGTWSDPQTTTTTVADAQDQLSSSWQNDSPAASALPCEFVYSLYPLTNLEGTAQGSQAVALDDQFVTVDSASTISQSTRVFATTAEASAYLSQMHRLIDGCTSYSTSSWSATVQPLTVGTSGLANAAWVETGTGTHAGAAYFAVDIQRGNLVTRVMGDAGSNGDGLLDKNFFNQVVGVAAANLKGAQPGSGQPDSGTSV